MSDGAEARRRARQSWPIRRHALGEPTSELLVGPSPSELVAMVHRLTLDAWAMANAPIPSYRRSDAVGRVIRRAS